MAPGQSGVDECCSSDSPYVVNICTGEKVTSAVVPGETLIEVYAESAV